MAVITETFTLMAGVLDRLRAGEVIVGDGSYVFTLEKRGYVKVRSHNCDHASLHPVVPRLASTHLSQPVSILTL